MRLVSALYGGGWRHYPFYALFPDAENITAKEPNHLERGDVLILWGGADISPTLYGRSLSRNGGGRADGPSQRDAAEWALLHRAVELDIPVIGVCRGAQMLCAYSGGYLIQDITGHAGPDHMITHVNGGMYLVNSLHHQMMVPDKAEHELLAWSSTQRSKHYEDEEGLVHMDVEPELIVFPKIKGVAAQWHPEMMPVETPATTMLFETIQKVMK